jgi:two-component system, NtrC family, sensor kinase
VRAWVNTVGEPEAVLKVVVADSGSGVPPDDIERIFDPFFTTKPIGQGTGLGLATSQAVVARHRGRLTLTSEPGHTVACVFLPVGPPEHQRTEEREHDAS